MNRCRLKNQMIIILELDNDEYQVLSNVLNVYKQQREFNHLYYRIIYLIKFVTVRCCARDTFCPLIFTTKSPDFSPHNAAGLFSVTFPINVGLSPTTVNPNESLIPR